MNKLNFMLIRIKDKKLSNYLENFCFPIYYVKTHTGVRKLGITKKIQLEKLR